jgi:hypothetical protein
VSFVERVFAFSCGSCPIVQCALLADPPLALVVLGLTVQFTMSAPAAAAPAAASSTDPKPSARRDLLVDIESRVQQRWESAQLWEANARDAATRKLEDKYLATFPYPYMNGVLHLGHGFTLAKVDFECAYQRLKGKNVLFPFGYRQSRETQCEMIWRAVAPCGRCCWWC